MSIHDQVHAPDHRPNGTPQEEAGVATDTRQPPLAPPPGQPILASKAFLARLRQHQGGPANNHFLAAARAGARTPDEVLAAVTCSVSNLLSQVEAIDDCASTYRHLLEMLRCHRGEALQLAQNAIEWVAIPLDERKRSRAEQSALYRGQYMAAQPATQPQLAKLRALGHRGVVANKAEASRLIDELTRGGGR